MACREDVRKVILDKINASFIEGRYSFTKVEDNLFIVTSPKIDTRTRASSLKGAIEIAKSLSSRITEEFGNNIEVDIDIPEYIGFPVKIKVEPTFEYIEKLFAQVFPDKRTEPVSTVGFKENPNISTNTVEKEVKDNVISKEEVTAQNIRQVTESIIQREILNTLRAIRGLELLKEEKFFGFSPYSKSRQDYFRGDEALLQQELAEEMELKLASQTTLTPETFKTDERGQFLLFQKPSTEGEIASEKTIRDLAARMSARIGIPYRIISDRTQEFKGKLEGNVAVINLAYATLDTPIHEILGHPIIRAIKYSTNIGGTITLKGLDTSTKKQELSQLYQNLLKELEYGKGKEVLDRIKRDYKETKAVFIEDASGTQTLISESRPYTLEEQQEEAIVELLGLMTAEKLDAVKDIKLISLLKQLLGRIKAFVRDIILQKEVNIDSLPDNMTIGDLASVLAYSNSKLILPGYEVEYTTPDNMKFKTYAEASNHISELAKSAEEVDLKNIKLDIIETIEERFNNLKETGEPLYSAKFDDGYYWRIVYKKDNWVDARGFENKPGWVEERGYDKNKPEVEYIMSEYKALEYFKTKFNKKEEFFKDDVLNKISQFIEKNKEYEQSKEIVEEWKKVNNIQYNPEEVYSRGQEFTSVVGAYSSFDVNLMMQNLLQHIEDNEKAGGEFTISAFTKPIDRQIGHLEGGGGKIKFKIYPKSKDIKWAANTDVYSGSVWDASEKISKDKKSELLGVSYTKYPALRNVNEVQPNLASIIADLAHHHNELGISLTGNNFRLEYDEDIPYQTKKIIDSVNAILDQKYGKLVKPEIKKENITKKYDVRTKYGLQQSDFNSEKEAREYIDNLNKQYNYSQEEYDDFRIVSKEISGIQPTQTKDNLKESINNVAFRIADLYEEGDTTGEGKPYLAPFGSPEFKQKEYTEQALINNKIAKLKEVAKKYPRSLIRSEVVLSNKIARENRYQGFEGDDLPFQKIPTTQQIKQLNELTSIPEVRGEIYFQSTQCK